MNQYDRDEYLHKLAKILDGQKMTQYLRAREQRSVKEAHLCGHGSAMKPQF